MVESSRARKKGRSRAPLAYLFAALLMIAIIVVVGLLVFRGRPEPPAQPQSAELADTAAVSQQIAQQCAMGRQTDEQATVSATLAKYLTHISAGARVKTSEVGALIDKIAPNDQGLAFYKAYTDCLKQQAAILLRQKGVALVPPSEAEIEGRKDEQLREQVSQLSPSAPKSRLVQLLGEPISTGDDESTNSPGLAADYYQYKHMLFVADYYKNGRRVALVLATKDPIQGAAMFPNQFRGVTLGEMMDVCGGVQISTRSNARTGICPASHASDYVKKVYFFESIASTGASEDASAACRRAIFGGSDFEARTCPGLASAPSFGVALAKESVRDEDLSDGADAWLEKMDFGGTFAWRSEREDRQLDQRERDEEPLADSARNALSQQERRRRILLMRNPITPSI